MAYRLLIFITKLAINALALIVADLVLTGLSIDSTRATIGAAVLLALVNTYLRPVIVLLTLPITILTLGLFTLVINAGMLYFVAWLLRPHVHVDGFWNALGGALVISVVSVLFNWFLKPGSVQVHVER